MAIFFDSTPHLLPNHAAMTSCSFVGKMTLTIDLRLRESWRCCRHYLSTTSSPNLAEVSLVQELMPGKAMQTSVTLAPAMIARHRMIQPCLLMRRCHLVIQTTPDTLKFQTAGPDHIENALKYVHSHPLHDHHLKKLYYDTLCIG